jgi:hypothetical protein
MDTKANLANRKKINELAIQHNKLTTLVGALLNEVNGLKKEVRDLRSGAPSDHSKSSDSSKAPSNNSGRFANFTDLRAEDILKQLSINSIDN